ncbi:MAG TPA: dTDP-4-dehydrorhamnose reductase [Alphaproteobacteria bacterium]|nr:dTDP-4-dehydrorhamnose reductase [Alphaproteobacteria bacterium]
MAEILILGAAGQLATALRALSWPAGCNLTFLGRRDLVSPGDPGGAARAAILRSRPNLVLNAAAYTAVDRAEAQPELAAAINAAQPLAMAQACSDLDIPLVHVSTDYVFDGDKPGAYLETDAPNPLGVYGRTKLAGDRNIEQHCSAPWAILRTSWVFSAAEDSFPAKLLRRARAGETLRVVDDQIGCPTPAAALAAAMQAVGLRLLDHDRAAEGLFNFCGAEAMSWYGFAGRIVAAAVAAGLRRPELQPISSDQFAAAARRPRNSVLDCGKIRRQCGLEPAPITAAVEHVVGTILGR